MLIDIFKSKQYWKEKYKFIVKREIYLSNNCKLYIIKQHKYYNATNK